jgi:hypothetical protein
MSSHTVNKVKCDGVVTEKGTKPDIYCPRVVPGFNSESHESIRKRLLRWERDEVNDKDYCPQCIQNKIFSEWESKRVKLNEKSRRNDN